MANIELPLVRAICACKIQIYIYIYIYRHYYWCIDNIIAVYTARVYYTLLIIVVMQTSLFI